MSLLTVTKFHLVRVVDASVGLCSVGKTKGGGEGSSTPYGVG